MWRLDLLVMQHCLKHITIFVGVLGGRFFLGHVVFKSTMPKPHLVTNSIVGKMESCPFKTFVCDDDNGCFEPLFV